MADYKLGSDDPKIRYDRGSGKWKSKKKTVVMEGLKAEILGYLNLPFWSSLVKITFGENARNHLRYYFRSKREAYCIETVEKMVKESASAKRVYLQELSLAKNFVETLPYGTHRITSGRASVGNNDRSGGGRGDRNWFYAVGSYSAWGKGTARVERAEGRKRRYHLQFEYKFRDYYNWNKGDRVRIGPTVIPDSVLGEFHRQGLAREFLMYGSWHHVVTWES